MNPFLYIAKSVAIGMVKLKVKKWLGLDKLEARMRKLEKHDANRVRR